MADHCVFLIESKAVQRQEEEQKWMSHINILVTEDQSKRRYLNEEGHVKGIGSGTSTRLHSLRISGTCLQ